MALRCDFGPDALRRTVACVASVSKNLEGELYALDREEEACKEHDCVSLTTLHAMKAEVAIHDCDARSSAELDGPLVVERLATIFENADPQARGVHAGDFIWRGQGIVVEGRMQGITNAGITRAPLSLDCERCHNPGVMIGRLCGHVTSRFFPPAPPSRLVGALFTAIYRFEFEPTDSGGEGRIVGVVEGALVQECATEPQCVDFAVLQDGPNPRIEQGHTITVFDHLGNPQPTTEIRTWGSVTGLHLWFNTSVDLAAPTALVRLTIAHFVVGATVTAFDSTGAQVAQATVTGPQGVPIEVPLAAPDITRLAIDCPNDENLLVRLCVEEA